jgi:hypothetical protein
VNTSEPDNPPDEKSPLRSCATVAAVALLVYLLSFGPAMWLVDRKILPAWTTPTVSFVYYPVFWTSMVGPRPVREAVRWYAELGAKRRPDNLIDDPAIPSRLGGENEP